MPLSPEELAALLKAHNAPVDTEQAPPSAATIPALPPAPPPPTPASAGFAAWAADPQNNSKVANSLVSPNTPIMPPNAAQAGQAATQQTTHSPQTAPAPYQAMPPIQSQADWQAAHPELLAHPTTEHAPGWRGKLASVADFAVPALLGAAGAYHGDPGAGLRYTADQQAYNRSVPDINQQRYQANVVEPYSAQASATEKAAKASKESQQAEDMTPQTLTAEQAVAINQPNLAGMQVMPRDYAKLLGMAGNNKTSQENNARTNDTKEANSKRSADLRKSLADSTNQIHLLISGNHDATIRQIAAGHDATSRSNNAANNARSEANNENTVSHKGTAAGGGFKVPADVTKRAALGNNVIENAAKAQKLIDTNPDIVGTVSGRFTNVQQMIGSDDDNIHELGVRMHNIALASNGAHGVRSAQAIAKTEDELFHNFHSGPNGIKGALRGTTDSVQTFLDDERNFATTGSRTGNAQGNTNEPADGTTKKNSHGDTVTFHKGKGWSL